MPSQPLWLHQGETYSVRANLMQTGDGVGAILCDHDGLVVLGTPSLKVRCQLQVDDLRVTDVTVPRVVAVQADHINKLCLGSGRERTNE